MRERESGKAMLSRVSPRSISLSSSAVLAAKLRLSIAAHATICVTSYYCVLSYRKMLNVASSTSLRWISPSLLSFMQPSEAARNHSEHRCAWVFVTVKREEPQTMHKCVCMSPSPASQCSMLAYVMPYMLSESSQ